jgi:hypothetical protein
MYVKSSLFNFGFSSRTFQGWIRIFNISVFQLPHFFFEGLEQSLPTVGIAKSPLSIGNQEGILEKIRIA